MKRITFTNEDMFETENEELKYKLMWLVPNAQKNEMEPIMITIEPGGRYIEEEPHEGEEFGYVLAGIIFLHLGEKNYKVKKGESFYFKHKEIIISQMPEKLLQKLFGLVLHHHFNLFFRKRCLY